MGSDLAETAARAFEQMLVERTVQQDKTLAHTVANLGAALGALTGDQQTRPIDTPGMDSPGHSTQR